MPKNKPSIEINSTHIEQGTGVARNHCAIAEPLAKGGKKIIPSMKKINAKPKDFSMLSTFSGCGGASVGFKLAGFEVIYANEFIKAAQDTYKVNHPNTKLDKRDIRKVDPIKLLKKLGLKRGELDTFEGSPPCKGYSSAGVQEEGWGKEVLYSDGVHQRVDDLFDEYIRMLQGLKPKTFVAENVSGMVKGVARGAFLETMRSFKDCGYRVKAALINASMLGLPQTRERLIYIGVRNDLKMDPVFPIPTVDKPVTVRDVLPNVVLIKTKVRGVLTYVSAERPSPTIVASDFDTGENASFSCGGWLEDDQGRRRKYNLLELRRLMGFPDDFKLTGKPRQQWERLGRSHSPLSVYHIAKTLRKEILEPYYDSKGVEYTDNIK